MVENPHTISNTRTGSPLPKVDTLDTNRDTITRVNSSDRKTDSKSTNVEVTEKEAATGDEPSYILTGKKLALAHTGFLLLVFLLSFPFPFPLFLNIPQIICVFTFIPSSSSLGPSSFHLSPKLSHPPVDTTSSPSHLKLYNKKSR